MVQRSWKIVSAVPVGDRVIIGRSFGRGAEMFCLGTRSLVLHYLRGRVSCSSLPG
jgi:hypothetical protein